MSASAIVDAHLFASPGHSTSFFVFPLIPKAPNWCSALWDTITMQECDYCASLRGCVHPEPLKLELVARQSLVMGAHSVFGSVSAHERAGGILASLAQCEWDSSADVPASPGSLQHTVRAGQHHHSQSGCALPHLSSYWAMQHVRQKARSPPATRLAIKSLQMVLKSQHSFYLSSWVFSFLPFWLSPHPTGGEWASGCIRSCHPLCWVDSLS